MQQWWRESELGEEHLPSSGFRWKLREGLGLGLVQSLFILTHLLGFPQHWNQLLGEGRSRKKKTSSERLACGGSCGDFAVENKMVLVIMDILLTKTRQWLNKNSHSFGQ